MQQPAIEYYKLQAQNFACLIKSTIEMIDKFLGLSGKDQLSEQDKATFRAFKLLFMGQLVEDIQQDLAYYDGSYHEDLATGVTKTSSHGAIDCTSRIIGDDLYFAALKQGVGLSLFKVSLK